MVHGAGSAREERAMKDFNGGKPSEGYDPFNLNTPHARWEAFRYKFFYPKGQGGGIALLLTKFLPLVK